MRILHPSLRWPIMVATIALLSACSTPGADEDQIAATLQEMAAALADGDVRGVIAPVAEDFTGISGDFDRRSARLLLMREQQAREQLNARLFDVDVSLRGEGRAVASFQVVLTGGSGLIPETGRWYRVESGWRRDGGEWMLVSAEWEAVAGRQ
ncbi:hypothetical protein IC757_07900 [Wenzhouxiangella sp. AB-CW3]|uniref:hypothetical protein n=1 Tax=Wenzhouxiangella sp. AB-CW3 TaxID=2771012 RepID=UPI00168B8A3C|nr:hypothetical protein [Wenzhouxiangella sp. AB-CW3]QOC24013.1 hypothetical protein IC757_07900 [Wenzhouxiangella sp. AB-CW3]